jgi:hypothetical protein
LRRRGRLRDIPKLTIRLSKPAFRFSKLVFRFASGSAITSAAVSLLKLALEVRLHLLAVKLTLEAGN